MSVRSALAIAAHGSDLTGDTKKARWAQIGMAMPPPLAAAVAESIRAWFGKADRRTREAIALLNGRAP